MGRCAMIGDSHDRVGWKAMQHAGNPAGRHHRVSERLAHDV